MPKVEGENVEDKDKDENEDENEEDKKDGANVIIQESNEEESAKKASRAASA